MALQGCGLFRCYCLFGTLDLPNAVMQSSIWSDEPARLQERRHDKGYKLSESWDSRMGASYRRSANLRIWEITTPSSTCNPFNPVSDLEL